MHYEPTTVYPSKAGGFPPATFFSFAESLSYVREMQWLGIDCGICTCPARSFEMHWREVCDRKPHYDQN